MKNSNFSLPVSCQKQEEEVKIDSNFDGRILGIVLAFLSLIGMFAYVDRWIPILSSLF